VFDLAMIPILVIVLLVTFFSMGLHEFGHAFMADRWGDPTPRQLGRLTPNPLVHANPGGWVFFFLIALGFVGLGQIASVLVLAFILFSVMTQGNMNFMALGSVPVNFRKMRDPRWGQFWTVLAGPLMNLAIAISCAIALRLLFDPLVVMSYWLRPSTIDTPFAFIGLFFFFGVLINCLLFVFNLLPLAPLDGWSIMQALLPGRFLSREQVPDTIRKNFRPLSAFLQEPAYKWSDWRQISYFVFLALIIISFMPFMPDVLGWVTNPPTFFLYRVLLGWG
jgi:Zn-dependent protease